jgi:hypothetical protein
MLPDVRPTLLDRLLRPLHRWIWREPGRRARKLLTFAETEADGGRDLTRAAELTSDGLLRRLYLRHALDEQRHAELFRQRGRAILAEVGESRQPGALQANWLAPGERGLDDLRVADQSPAQLLAFLHLSEKAAAGRFAVYRDVLEHDPTTHAVFSDVLRDEAFHMNYTYMQLLRVSRTRPRRSLYWARAGRLWKGYLRLATAIAGVLGAVVLLAQYFVVLPLFAWAAKRGQRREPLGFHVPIRREPTRALQTQY